MSADVKSKRVFVPVSPEDHAIFVQTAWRMGISVAELLRQGGRKFVEGRDRSAAAKRMKQR
jgi:hypothetical protein